MSTESSARMLSGQRSVARKLALQALYRWQLNECPWQDLIQEFRDAEDMPRADREYFRELVEGVWRAREALDADLASWADRSPALLDPIEHAILLIGAVRAASSPGRAFSSRDQRGGEPGQALRRHRRPQVRQRGVGSGGARRASRRALSCVSLSEFDLIERYFRGCGARRADVRVGVGDDAADSRLSRGRGAGRRRSIPWSMACTFRTARPAASVGHRALAVNLSDLAAMGARPAWALLALTLPAADEAWLSEFAAGMAALARAHEVALVGGDTTSGPLCVTVQVLGHVPRVDRAAALGWRGRRRRLRIGDSRRCERRTRARAGQARCRGGGGRVPARALPLPHAAGGARGMPAPPRERLHRRIRWPAGGCGQAGPRQRLRRGARLRGGARVGGAGARRGGGARARARADRRGRLRALLQRAAGARRQAAERIAAGALGLHAHRRDCARRPARTYCAAAQ